MVVESLVNYWNILASSGDVRVNDYPFVQKPTAVICASLSYLFIVTFGPRYMAKRNPLDIRKVLIFYNFISVLFSVWMVWEFFACTFLNPGFNLLHHESDENDTSPTTQRLIRAHWFYFMSKFFEFCDTFFFVVRKKNNQISFLHVYHHVSMLILQWCLLKFVPGGMSYFGPFINSFIHAVMYAYYMLSAFGPHMQKYLWWKKYLTRMQMYQFILVFFYCSNLVSVTKDTEYVLAWFHWFYVITLFWLFNHFYQQAYTIKKAEKGKSDEVCKTE